MYTASAIFAYVVSKALYIFTTRALFKELITRKAKYHWSEKRVFKTCWADGNIATSNTTAQNNLQRNLRLVQTQWFQ